MPKKTIIACAACLGIVFGLLLCFRSLPRSARSQPEHHHAPDWKLEVVVQAPRLIYPTAITVAPDGRVFVGQDPIDMTGPADQPLDSVVCVHPSGKITVFATNLHCVFGLEYLDGKLYVNHAPKLSVFTDRDSVGADRSDLLDYTNPRQLLAGALTHIPAGIHWAMDGFIYMAVGDTGIYQMIGKDGRKLSMHSGGIIRFRPDGTGLEIYATGTRNHPDLAINAEGEIFTYDNTDDGQGWWTRVTHMVDGGFYGYPWEYSPRRPYTLWMMGDYGDGSGTAALAYNEDSLPAEFHGNLFLGDYARSQLMRLRVERDGGTYRILRREMNNDQDFVTRGAKDFRPIGVAVSPDGMSFFITDWNTDQALVEDVTGRLLKLTYLGKSRATPRPSWVALAGAGKTFNASTADLLAALQHPAQSVRLIAQRQLAARGAESAPVLIRLLEDRGASSSARWSALWALDAWDGGMTGRKAIITALNDPDSGVRRQAARQLGTRKASAAVPNLIKLLKDQDASVRFQAATALGRIGASASIPALQEALVEKDLFARYAAFTALNRIGRAWPEAWKEIATALSSPLEEIREGVVFAVRGEFSLPLVRLLCDYATNASSPLDTRVAVVEAIGEIARQPAEWKGDWWGATGINPASRPRPANTQNWESTPAATVTLREALNDPLPRIRGAAVLGLKRCHDVGSCELLHQLVGRETDPAVANEILTTLGEFRDPQFDQILRFASHDTTRFAPLLPNVIAAAEQVGSPGVVASLTDLVDVKFAEPLRLLSLQALTRLRAESAIPAIAKLIDEDGSNFWR
ncbi:MAG TPA: HEAT repeat domain-containing protein, partial [Candidatus Eisenbacteria bacterium]|nr:HEAT repeat domain-containing protein [Candidatus Eisenbacteria bacterium]